jgi:hypothetical protein
MHSQAKPVDGLMNMSTDDSLPAVGHSLNAELTADDSSSEDEELRLRPRPTTEEKKLSLMKI